MNPLAWRRDGRRREQVANACDDFVDLTPASEVPAQLVETNWSPLLPMIGDCDGEEEECC